MKTKQNVILSPGSGEIIEKHSRFLAFACCVQTEEAALALAEKRKKEYWDARHTCFAYRILPDGRPPEIVRAADDGEPQGSAGRPILEVLTGRDLYDAVILVTRYFGGTLLGVGGLVRAYQAAAAAALDQCEIAQRILGRRFRVTCGYDDYGKIDAFLQKSGAAVLTSEFAEKVTLETVTDSSGAERFSRQIADLTNGRAGESDLGEVSYAMTNGQMRFF